MAATTLMNHLREATRAAHGGLESLPYFQALGEGQLPIECYVGHLRALGALHEVLEEELASGLEAHFKSVWAEGMRRFPQIQVDLDWLSPMAVPVNEAAQTASQSLASQMLRRAKEQPLSLLGYLYVLEGSIGGAKVLGPRFGQVFGLDEHHGLAYFTWEPEVAAARWQEFCTRMNDLLVDAGNRDSIASAACEAFTGLHQVLEALHPLAGQRPAQDLLSLNPEAGDHPVPVDPTELEAAHRAATRCWNEFPYLALRFGERGWRFTQSDGAWLVTLAERSQKIIDEQIAWLGGTLAARGLPHLLLQRKLELLHEELTRGKTQRVAKRYQRLQVAAEHLAGQRRARLADAEAEAIIARFEAAIGPEWRARLPRTGALLVCAAVDHAQGLERALSSLLDWLTDPQHFPPQWITAVHQASDEAQARLQR